MRFSFGREIASPVLMRIDVLGESFCECNEISPVRIPAFKLADSLASSFTCFRSLFLPGFQDESLDFLTLDRPVFHPSIVHLMKMKGRAYFWNNKALMTKD